MVIVDKYISSYEKKLIEKNKRCWENKKSVSSGKEWIYVYHNLPYGLDFSMHEDIFAKGMQEKEGLPIVAVTYEQKRRVLDELDESFGIHEKEILMCGEKPGAIASIRSYLAAKWLMLKTYKNKEALCNMKYRGIDCGDIIYDDILRYCDCKDFDCFGISRQTYFNSLMLAFRIIEQSYKILKKRRPKHVITSECIYSKGLFASVAKKLGADITIVSSEAFDITVKITSEKSLFKDIKMADVTRTQIMGHLDENYSGDGNTDYFIYKRGSDLKGTLREKLGINNSDKNVFIMPHAIADGPRTAYTLYAYKDYGEWYAETLKIIKEIPGVNWIIKDHPASNMYGQGSYIRKVFEENKSENMYWCEKEASGMQIKEMADAIVTCASDVGIEYWAYGIPTITTAKTHYTTFGISYNVKTKEQYIQTLKNIGSLQKPGDESVKEARVIMQAYNRLMESDEPLTKIFLQVRAGELEQYEVRNFTCTIYYYLFCKDYEKVLLDDKLFSSDYYQLRNVFEL